MGRPRGFDETEVVDAAVGLFATRSYDGVSVDDLVTALGVHRNSLYQTFGSKRGLYLRALRHAIDRGVLELRGAGGVGEKTFTDETFDLVMLAAVERAGHDPEVAAEVARAFGVLDQALGPAGATRLLGLRVRSRARPTKAPTGRTG